MRTENLTPHASILIESMRDIGYTLEAAVSDIVDNSIAARASTIEIFAEHLDGEYAIGILDNGTGMSRVELLSAMRIGSRHPKELREVDDLGRFGLGLKTASFSQCRRLSVVSRTKKEVTAAVWDLDYVAEVNEWSVQVPEDLSVIPWSDKLTGPGTLVVWENIDRVVDVDQARQSGLFANRLTECTEHLQLTFHRFLSGESGTRKLKIVLNNRKLIPYDPFHANHPATEKEPNRPEVIKVGSSEVTFQTFTLPHHKKVTDSEWNRYAGPEGYVRNQGFYIYREKRLIIHGTWFGLARQSELTKLARVRVDIPNTLDSEWKIDVKKSSAQPPAVVKERLRMIVERIGATSKRVYTSRGTVRVTDERLPVWDRVQNKSEISYRLNSQHPLLTSFVEQLPDDLLTPFATLLELIAGTIPVEAVYADMGGSPELVRASSVSEETLRQTLDGIISVLGNGSVNMADIEPLIKFTEPFKSNWTQTSEILARIYAGSTND